MIDKTFPITEKLLATGLRSTEQLFQLLTCEHQQLKQKTDPSAIANLIGNKKEIVVQLEQFSKQLGQVLATEKLPNNHEGILNYLAKAEATHIDTQNAQQCWQDIEALCKKCRALNEQNGASIDLLSRHTQRCLQVLRGKSQLTATYGPDGSTRSVLFSHTLISV